MAAQAAQIRNAGIDVPVLTLSNVTRDGMMELQGVLESGRTYCFVGSSGVGKSTLINGLIGCDVLETKVVSGTGEGRHATVRRELIVLANGAMVIDNPGMRELGVLGAGDGLEASFADIMARAGYCRFRDCTHTSEPARHGTFHRLVARGLPLLAHHLALRVRHHHHLGRVGGVTKRVRGHLHTHDLEVVVAPRLAPGGTHEMLVRVPVALHPLIGVAAQGVHIDAHRVRARARPLAAERARHAIEVRMLTGENGAHGLVAGAGLLLAPRHQPSPRHVYCRSVLNSMASSTDPRRPVCSMPRAKACLASSRARAGGSPMRMPRQNASCSGAAK